MQRLGEAMRVLLLAAGLAVLCLRGESGLSLHVIDVGQGDGMLLRVQGEAILIDGGSSDRSNVGQYQLIPLLQYYGVREVSCLVTHEDEDHISGVRELMEAQDGGIHIKTLFLPDTAQTARTEALLALEALAAKQGIPVQYLAEGDVLRKGKMQLKCLHPEANNSYAEPNERSVTLYLTYGAFSCLLTGDLEGEGEDRLLEYVRTCGDELDSELTLLHVAHHGSNGATSAAFLKEFTPQYAFVSCGEGNRYGHPGEEAMGRLKEAGVERIFDTRYSGEIVFHTNGKKLTVNEFKKGHDANAVPGASEE